jgi:hypothetical protein
MRRQTRASPQNSLITIMDAAFVLDTDGAETPDSLNENSCVTATPSCLVVRTFAAVDGPTSLTLGDEVPAGSGKSLAFSGVVQTPNKSLEVCTVLFDVILSCELLEAETEIQIWTNHSIRPDEIDIVVPLVARFTDRGGEQLIIR